MSSRSQIAVQVPAPRKHTSTLDPWNSDPTAYPVLVFAGPGYEKALERMVRLLVDSITTSRTPRGERLEYEVRIRGSHFTRQSSYRIGD